MENLAQLEALCERLYNSQDSAERAHAESSLKCFSNNSNYLQCQYILDNVSTPYALRLASSSLLKQVTEQRLSSQLPDIWNYLLRYLASRGPELESFVIGSLIQLLCRVTKFGWFDDENFREVVKESMSFLSQGTRHYAIGLKILNQLVCEVNEPNPLLPQTYQRRVACAFRDRSLLQIFQISLTALSQLKNDVESKLQELALSLALRCLSFDFLGTSVDESSDDFGTVQVPSFWKSVLEDSSTLQIFFDYYAITKPRVSREALECLVRLASVRRALFANEAARLKYLAHLMRGTKEILETGKGLGEHDNYHEFCRLLGRFKVNYQLAEIVNMENYGDWIRLVAQFTVQSLQSWQWASGSVYYLLGLWSRLVSSVPYLKCNTPNLLNEYVPKIMEQFVISKFNYIQDSLLDDNPLDSPELLQDQLDCISYLSRFQYERCTMHIIQTTTPVLQNYVDAVNVKPFRDHHQLFSIETKLTWVVHIIAAIVKSKQLSGFSGDSQEIHDAELSALVFRLINISDCDLLNQRFSELSKQRLDRAILIFFQHFMKSYVGGQAIQLSKPLYTRLSELIGLDDHLLVLNVIVGKIVSNLKCYAEIEEVISHTLTLFLEMASGPVTAKLLPKLDTVQLIVSHHTRDHFRFLKDRNRNRTAFYYIIGLLMFMDDSPLKFRASMDPLLQVLGSLESTPDVAFHTETVQRVVIGLMRDLRGIAMATNSRRTYGFLFDWLYPAHMPLLLKSISHWADTPELTTPLLKFVAEFVLNKSNRLTFDTSSPNGILLFRDVSKLIVSYGTRILSLPSPADAYTFKYKGTWICLTILSRALGGKYVNFGVFEVYGDRALVDVLDIVMKMVLSIPLNDILAYRKLTGAYFTFLDILLKYHITYILNMDSSSLMFVAGSLQSGFQLLDTNILSQCASAVDNLATFYFNNVIVEESPTSPASLNFAHHVSDCGSIFFGILKALFEIVLFEDRGNQWSLSRPMLSLILLSEQMFRDLKAHILASQVGPITSFCGDVNIREGFKSFYQVTLLIKSADQQQRLSLCFDKLTADVTRSLQQKNREKFTNNLARFKNEFLSR